jgi:ubiquinone/menaquinone biosynthesis C-methylase UbiE
MLKKLFKNAGKPEGLGGRLLLLTMRKAHRPISEWGLGLLGAAPSGVILDIGCGGGDNIARMLKMFPSGRVYGLDYSELCVKKSSELNQRAILEGRAEIRLGSVSENPWPDDTFDAATAFETVYFWPDFIHDLREVRRVLKPGGTMLICNEAIADEKGKSSHSHWEKLIDMKIYSREDYKHALTEAGFGDVEIHTGGESRIGVKAKAAKREALIGL